MSDLVERLRRNADDQNLCGVDAGRTGTCHAAFTMDQAADRIEELEKALAEYKKQADGYYHEAADAMAEIERLRGALMDAYYEGWDDAKHILTIDVDIAWNLSEAKALTVVEEVLHDDEARRKAAQSGP